MDIYTNYIYIYQVTQHGWVEWGQVIGQRGGVCAFCWHPGDHHREVGRGEQFRVKVAPLCQLALRDKKHIGLRVNPNPFGTAGLRVSPSADWVNPKTRIQADSSVSFYLAGPEQEVGVNPNLVG